MLNVTIICKCHYAAHFFKYKSYDELFKDIKSNEHTTFQVVITDATDDEITNQNLAEIENDCVVNLERFFK